MSEKPDTTVVLDLETPRTFHDVGGYDKMHLLGISVCGVYFYETDTYRAFRVEELPELEEYFIKNTPAIVGFNHLHFDLPVLQPYCKNLDLTTLPGTDIMAEVQKSEGIRLKLDTLANGTLLEGKSGDGLDAVRYYRQGDWDSLIKYCLDDVRITRDLFEFGRNHGKLYYQSGGEARAVKVGWGGSKTKTVEDELNEAWKHHRQVRITYRELNDEGRPVDASTTVDVREIDERHAHVYCHDQHVEKRILVRLIQSVQPLETASAHQSAFF